MKFQHPVIPFLEHPLPEGVPPQVLQKLGNVVLKIIVAIKTFSTVPIHLTTYLIYRYIDES